MKISIKVFAFLMMLMAVLNFVGCDKRYAELNIDADTIIYKPGEDGTIYFPSEDTELPEPPDTTAVPDTAAVSDTTAAPDTTEVPDTTAAPDTTEVPDTTETPDITEATQDETDGVVYWVENGEVWHITEKCPSLSRSKHILSGSINEAQNAGKGRACKRCS